MINSSGIESARLRRSSWHCDDYVGCGRRADSRQVIVDEKLVILVAVASATTIMTMMRLSKIAVRFELRVAPIVESLGWSL
jgi:hypothetical protein